MITDRRSIRDVQSTMPALDTANYGMAPGAGLHIEKILRGMYSDPLRAVVREYISNAIDIHRMHRVTKPIQIHAPDQMEPWFSVRDYGPGMSDEEIKQYLFHFGATHKDKSSSDSMIGGFGIGCKCGFALRDSFTYTVFRGGRQTAWLCHLDEADKCQTQKFIDQPTDEPDGVLVKIGIESSSEMTRAAKLIVSHTAYTDDVKFELEGGIEGEPYLREYVTEYQVGNCVFKVWLTNGVDQGDAAAKSYCPEKIGLLFGGIPTPISSNSKSMIMDKIPPSSKSVLRALCQLAAFGTVAIDIPVGYVPQPPTREDVMSNAKCIAKLTEACCAGIAAVAETATSSANQMRLASADTGNNTADGVITLGRLQGLSAIRAAQTGAGSGPYGVIAAGMARLAPDLWEKHRIKMPEGVCPGLSDTKNVSIQTSYRRGRYMLTADTSSTALGFPTPDILVAHDGGETRSPNGGIELVAAPGCAFVLSEDASLAASRIVGHVTYTQRTGVKRETSARLNAPKQLVVLSVPDACDRDWISRNNPSQVFYTLEDLQLDADNVVKNIGKPLNLRPVTMLTFGECRNMPRERKTLPAGLAYLLPGVLENGTDYHNNGVFVPGRASSAYNAPLASQTYGKALQALHGQKISLITDIRSAQGHAESMEYLSGKLLPASQLDVDLVLGLQKLTGATPALIVALLEEQELLQQLDVLSRTLVRIEVCKHPGMKHWSSKLVTLARTHVHVSEDNQLAGLLRMCEYAASLQSALSNSGGKPRLSTKMLKTHFKCAPETRRVIKTSNALTDACGISVNDVRISANSKKRFNLLINH